MPPFAYRAPYRYQRAAALAVRRAARELERREAERLVGQLRRVLQHAEEVQASAASLEAAEAALARLRVCAMALDVNTDDPRVARSLNSASRALDAARAAAAAAEAAHAQRAAEAERALHAVARQRAARTLAWRRADARHARPGPAPPPAAGPR